VRLRVQSLIPEIAELTIFYLNLVTLARLNATNRKKRIQQKFGGEVPAGFVCYRFRRPLTSRLRCAPRSRGDDQEPMIEQTRRSSEV
jgi:tryptophanyl-tRNA synthetase